MPVQGGRLMARFAPASSSVVESVAVFDHREAWYRVGERVAGRPPALPLIEAPGPCLAGCHEEAQRCKPRVSAASGGAMKCGGEPAAPVVATDERRRAVPAMPTRPGARVGSSTPLLFVRARLSRSWHERVHGAREQHEQRRGVGVRGGAGENATDALTDDPEDDVDSDR